MTTQTIERTTTTITNKLNADHEVNKLMQTATIHSSMDYDSFHFYGANRPVDMKHVMDIVESMETFGNLSVGVVVMFKGKKYIVDSQHRFKAIKFLNIPFDYKMVTVESEEELVRLMSALNSNAKKWNTEVYLNAWAYEGKKAYVWLKELAEDFKSTTLANFKTIFGWNTKEFENGDWTISKADFNKGVRIVRNIEASTATFDKGINAQPLRAIIKVCTHSNYNQKVMMSIVKNNAGLSLGCQHALLRDLVNYLAMEGILMTELLPKD